MEWIISDLHLGHTNLQKYRGRPTNADELILKNLNMVTDTLYCLGDFCIGRDTYWHEKLRDYDFRKILIKGNHDRKSDKWYIEHGWDFVAQRIDIKRYGKLIALTHEPVQSIYYSFDLNIHGHWHNNDGNKLGYYAHNKFLFVLEHHYKPILLRDIVERKV